MYSSSMTSRLWFCTAVVSTDKKLQNFKKIRQRQLLQFSVVSVAFFFCHQWEKQLFCYSHGFNIFVAHIAWKCNFIFLTGSGVHSLYCSKTFARSLGFPFSRLNDQPIMTTKHRYWRTNTIGYSCCPYIMTPYFLNYSLQKTHPFLKNMWYHSLLVKIVKITI